MENKNGFIYILTNPSFPNYVKIGYADNVEDRLRQLNRSECTPFAFRVYATYEVSSRLTDMKIHNMIDKLNPDLRSIDNINGKKRIREFYAMSPEDAYSIFEAIAEINGFEERLKKWTQTEEQQAEEKQAAEDYNAAKSKAKSFTFSSCGIAPGEKVEFVKNNNLHNGTDVTVVDEKHVAYDGQTWTLTGLAAFFLETDYHIPGPDYYKYKGKWINDIRREKGLINFQYFYMQNAYLDD